MKQNLLNKLRKLSEHDLYIALYCDHLTEVLNRRAFNESHSNYVALVDIDSLKYVNDTVGHRSGDSLLIAMARGLTGVFGDLDVYRLSGDEFAVRGKYLLGIRAGLNKIRHEFPGFSYGIDLDLVEADKNLILEKSQRERIGLRAPRGEAPPWFVSTN